MADLNKIFVYVGSGKSTDFLGKYVNPTEGVDRDTSMDSKVVFIEDTNEIVTHGKKFGLNNAAEVSALTTLIGTLPKRPAVGTEGETGYEPERDYASIIEYINEMSTSQASVSTKISTDITVAGGPLADDITDVAWPWGTKDGNKIIPAGTSFEEIFTKLFLAVKNGTISLGTIAWSPSLSQPTASLDKSGEQEVGTTTKVTYATTSDVRANTRSVTATASDGYFKNDGTWTSGNCVLSKAGTATGNVSIESATWNNTAVDNNVEVTIKEGTNTLAVKQSGITASVDALDADTIYASSNTKQKLTSVSVTVSDTKPVDKSLSSNKSVNITGVRYMFSGSSVTQNDTIDSDVIRGLNGIKAEAKASTKDVSKYSVSIVEGAKQVIIAVPAAYSVTNVYDSGAFGTDIFESSFEESTVDVEGANGFTATSYKVYVYKPASALGANTYYVKVTKP